MPCPLTLDGWLTFNEDRWSATAHRVEIGLDESDKSGFVAVGYLDRRGRYVLPPMNPHWPVAFHPTPTQIVSRREHQWLENASYLVEHMLAHGTRGTVALPPEVTDPRPWVWAGFQVRALFTYYIDFPYEVRQAHSGVRKQIRRAIRSGLSARPADRVEDVLECLHETESRQGFDLQLNHETLKHGLQLIGPDAFRLYVCYASDGDPACARIILHSPQGRACGLAAGTKAKYRSQGANQLLLQHVLVDLHHAGASGFNFCGANLKSVAASKASFGCRLMPQYGIEGFDYLPMKRALGRLVRLFRSQRVARGCRGTTLA